MAKKGNCCDGCDHDSACIASAMVRMVASVMTEMV